MLIEPSKELETFAMQYRNDYIEHGETHINGSYGFIHYSNYDEWRQKVILAHNKDTSFINVPATTYFTVRKADNKIISTLKCRRNRRRE
jgi:predicted acetyltransferase